MEKTIIKMNAEYILIVFVLMNVAKIINWNNRGMHKDESGHDIHGIDESIIIEESGYQFED
jgi:hypothetical protein